MSTIRSHPDAWRRTAGQAAAALSAEGAFADRHTWRTQLSRCRLASPPRGADAAYDTIIGWFVCRLPRTGPLLRQAEAVLRRHEALTDASSRSLADEADRLGREFRRGRQTPGNVLDALALIREAARRTIGLTPYREQVAASLALHRGMFVEMATGEGKTLAATAPAILAGFRGHGCHVITVNDYLAQRDAQQMKPLYEFFGLRVAFITQQSDAAQRRDAYAADITYCTNKEVAADFLRDHVAVHGRPDLTRTLIDRLGLRPSPGAQTVMRGLTCAIVDEADSILIDEAVTPLILSTHLPSGEQDPCYVQALDLTGDLRPDEDFQVDARHRELHLTRRGERRIAAAAAALGGVWNSRRVQLELARQALTARYLFLRDRHYVVQDGRVVIVDEPTGRLMPDRTWRHGLHQMIEAKERVATSAPPVTLAQISFQKFFRLYRKLSGMTGTAWESRFELRQVYRLATVRIPTHKPCRRVVEPPVLCADRCDKLRRLVADVQAMHATGRPILIGTRHVAISARVSEHLCAAGLPHVVLNAIHHADEAAIVARAGRRGAITVATNMAGRGTDIKLGPGVAQRGGLCVLAFEPNDSRRIDRQLFGRAARQGDPGSARLYLAPDDEIFRNMYGSPRLTGWRRAVGLRIAQCFAQDAADRLGFARRRAVLQADYWLDQHLGFTAPDH